MKEAAEKKPRTRQTYEPGYQVKVAKMVKSVDDVGRVSKETGVHQSTVQLWFLTLRALGEDHFRTRKGPRGGAADLVDLEARVSRIERELGLERSAT